MDLTPQPNEEAFRAEIRAFLKESLSDDIKLAPRVGNAVDKNVLTKWHKALYARGWVAPSWPKEFGGTGWSTTEKQIFAEELALAGAPVLMPFGLDMVGPVIFSLGNEAQKKQHLPGILNGDVWWCQGYSEPGAGSDLASLKTKAVRDGDDYVVNGQKIWTSFAHMADWMFCLVRTDDKSKPQDGITFLLIDMKTPGIQVRPLVSIDELHHLNEVFFTDVRVPVTNRIGEEGKGWSYAKFLLTHERTTIAGVPEMKFNMNILRNIAKSERAGDGTSLWDDYDFREKFAAIEVELSALEITNFRVLAESPESTGARSSILKVIGTELQQRLHTLGVEAIGYYTQPSQREGLERNSNTAQVGPDYVNTVFVSYALGRAASIYGGSNEIQRNVLAKAELGL
jgi:alkylation response protein AidB-like acyl-CoA dehydrogenase